MKKITTILLLLLLISSSFAQNSRAEIRALNIKAVLNQEIANYPAGTSLTICGYGKRQSVEGDALIVQFDSLQRAFPASLKKKLTFLPETTTEFWQSVCIQNNVYEYLTSKKSQTPLRDELNENSREFVSQLKDFTYDDPYVVNYLQTVFVRLIPTDSEINRGERLTVRLIQSPYPDAYMLPNGTMIIGTGLLAALDSEDELAAIIATEVTHYLLDDQVTSVKRALRRYQNTAFWGSILVGVAQIGAEAALYEDNPKSAALSLAVGTAAGIGSVATLVSAPEVNDLGLNYSMKQETAADKIVVSFLKFKGYNPNALGSALGKIMQNYQRQRQTKKLVRYGSTKNLDDRLDKLDRTVNLQSYDFQKTMSEIVTLTASTFQSDKDYRSAYAFARKNIDSHVASEHDYVIYVQSRMEMDNSPKGNEKCLELIRKAKEISAAPNLDIYKQEALLLIRLNNYPEASGVLKEYMNLLSDYQAQPDSKEDKEWIMQEMEWSKEMLLKANAS